MSQPCMRLCYHHRSLNSWNTPVQPDSDPGSRFLRTFLQTNCCLVTCSLSVKWYHSIVFPPSSAVMALRSRQTDGSGMQIICKNLGHEDVFGCWRGSFPVIQLKRKVFLSLVWQSKRRNASSEHLSLNSPPRQSVWQTWQSCQAHQINTRVREWEHLGGGKRDGSQSQLVSAYATLNNAPFQMVNLLNLRLPLAPHSQRARRAPGREHKDSSRAAMTEEQPQQSLLLSVRSADALNMSLLQCERWTFKSTCGSHYSSHLRNTQIR